MGVGKRVMGCSAAARRFLLAVCICCLPAGALRVEATPQAPSASVNGTLTVTSSDGHATAVSGVSVQLAGPSPAITTQTVETNAEGHFEFTRLTGGTYTLSVSTAGFKPWSVTLKLFAGQAAVQDAELQITSVEEKVEVTGETLEVATQSVSATATVSEEQLEKLPLRTEKFTEALSESPSVIRTQGGRLNFNGQAESQGMLLVDSAENVDPVSGSFAVPIPVDAIQSIQVFSTPDSAAFGGFTGGLTRIEIRPPSPLWNYKVLDFLPSFRGKNDHLVGIANITPRVEVGGPLIKDKLNFSEDVTYEFRRDPVRGLSWPYNETYVYSFQTFTELQYIFSSKHLFSANLNVFPSTNLYSNIDSLIPQSASENFVRRGVSAGFSDSYQFDSGALLNTVVRYTNFYSNAHGQGTADMTISPIGYGGNFFNAWWRNANQLQAIPTYQLPEKNWGGQHELRFGLDILYRQYDSSNVSQPINILDQNSVLQETISFTGPGKLHAEETEAAFYGEDHWTLSKDLSINYGARVSTQTLGRAIEIAPRVGVAYSLFGGKAVLRGGTGVIQGHVPLLAPDFTGNQTRRGSFFSRPKAGRTITLQNVYMPSVTSSGGTEEPPNSARTFTWNVEIDSPIRRNLDLRLEYYETHTTALFIVNPIYPATGSSGYLALQDTGSSNYRQAQFSVRYRPTERAELNASYVWSQVRGDLNSLADTFIQFQEPILRQNAYGIQSSDVPSRFLAWGFLRLPRGFVLSPVMDAHTGFPYSNFDVLQEYVGVPNTSRFPYYFSVDAKLYRDFNIWIPFRDHSKRHKIRLGVFSTDVTNHQNPHDVFSNTALVPPGTLNPAGNPTFGLFDGFDRRFTGLAIGMGQ